MNRMISFLFGVIWILVSSPLVASDNEERLVLIGKQLEFEALPPPCEGQNKVRKGAAIEEICIPLASGYYLKYSVVKILEGEYEGNSIEFTAYDHYGAPAFSRYDIAMIYLIKSGDQWYHQKYTWDKVYETVEGEYADCSLNWIEWEEDEYRGILKPVSFIKPVLFDISHWSRKLRKKYSNSPLFIVKGDRLTCKKGHYARDMLKEQRASEPK